jgi:hypothetical protein
VLQLLQRLPVPGQPVLLRLPRHRLRADLALVAVLQRVLAIRLVRLRLPRRLRKLHHGWLPQLDVARLRLVHERPWGLVCGLLPLLVPRDRRRWMLTRRTVIAARLGVLGAVLAAALVALSGARLEERTPLVVLAFVLAAVAGIGSAWSP